MNLYPLNKVKEKFKRKEPVKIVCYGDSMTWGYNDGNVQSVNNYPSVLQNKLRYIYGYDQITVLNKGVSGCTSSYGLAEFEPQIVSENPDMVVIMWGLNDALYINTDKFVSNLKNMVEIAIDNGIEVLLSTQIPIISRELGLMYGLENKNFANAIEYVAKDKNVGFVDVYSEMNELFKNGAIGLEFYEQGGHPLNYNLIADIILAKSLCDIFQPCYKKGDLINFETNQVYNSILIKDSNYYVLSKDVPNKKIMFMVYSNIKNAILKFNIKSDSGNITVKNFGNTMQILDPVNSLILLQEPGIYLIELRSENVEDLKQFKVSSATFNPISETQQSQSQIIPVSSTRGTTIGGYVKNGNIVNVMVKLNTTVVASPYVFMVDGLPKALFDGVGFVGKDVSTGMSVEFNYYDTHIANVNSLPIGTYIISGSYISLE